MTHEHVVNIKHVWTPDTLKTVNPLAETHSVNDALVQLLIYWKQANDRFLKGELSTGNATVTITVEVDYDQQ